ncbi:MAG: hypothetical protein V1667_03400 [bacterium]
MFKENFPVAEKFNADKETDQEIKKNPKEFVSWFEQLKNSLTEADYKKIYKNNKIRKAFVLASVPFSVLRVGEAMAETKSQDIVSGLANLSAISEKAETKKYAMVNSDELISVEDKSQRKKIAESINAEMGAFDNLSLELNDSLRDKKYLLPDEIIDKLGKGEKAVDFAGNMKENIVNMEKWPKNADKIFENGKLQYSNLAKIFGESLGAFQLSVIAHELGHAEEASRQGASKTDVNINFLSGRASYEGKLKNRTVVTAAGINKSQAFGDFLADNLKSDKAPDQITAILALAAKSNGMLYSLRSQFADQAIKNDDIAAYAKKNNISVSELALGLSAAFLGNIENWKLAGIAMGKDGVKLSDKTIAPFYNLGDSGPEYGIKFKANF